MGPHCEFCGTRCFVPFPANTPPEAREAYGRFISVVATCQRGQAFERR